MTNHPNRPSRKPDRRPDFFGTTIEVKRVYSNVIEYTLRDDQGEWTYHANRVATFHGPHTGGSARQLMGGASTLWRDRDDDMIKAFSKWYPNADVEIV